MSRNKDEEVILFDCNDERLVACLLTLPCCCLMRVEHRDEMMIFFFECHSRCCQPAKKYRAMLVLGRTFVACLSGEGKSYFPFSSPFVTRTKDGPCDRDKINKQPQTNKSINQHKNNNSSNKQRYSSQFIFILQ